MVELAVEAPVVVVLTPPLTLAPVDAPTLVTELVAAVERAAAEAVVVAGLEVDDDDDAAPFCNVDIKPPYLNHLHSP